MLIKKRNIDISSLVKPILRLKQTYRLTELQKSFSWQFPVCCLANTETSSIYLIKIENNGGGVASFNGKVRISRVQKSSKGLRQGYKQEKDTPTSQFIGGNAEYRKAAFSFCECIGVKQANVGNAQIFLEKWREP